MQISGRTNSLLGLRRTQKVGRDMCPMHGIMQLSCQSITDVSFRLSRETQIDREKCRKLGPPCAGQKGFDLAIGIGAAQIIPTADQALE